MTLYHSTGIIAASGGAAAKPGMVLLTPTSIAHSGTSASIGANGQVTFTAVTSLSLNGVFSATYDNYMLAIQAKDQSISMRMRSSGTDDTGTNYTRQYLDGNGATVSAGRETSQTSMFLFSPLSTPRGGGTIFVYGPFLAQPTATRSVGIAGNSSAYLENNACTHSLSTSYDGFTLVSVGTTGTLTVYGVRS